MALSRLRFFSCLLATALAFPLPSAAFDSPLSDTAIRQAYFLGQRHDESLARFFEKYSKHLSPPKSGPYISSLSFLTPYALLAQLSSEHAFGYSAQQAQIDHRAIRETVKITIEIQLTDTYPSVMRNPNGLTSGTPWDYIPRPSDFWRDFQVQVISDGKVLTPFLYTGEPNYICGDSGSQTLAPGEFCTLTGATVHLEFPAEAFAPDTATIQIDPPEGEQVLVDFDLSLLR